MNPIEEDIIAKLKKNPFYVSESAINRLDFLPLGTLSTEFYNDPSVKKYCAIKPYSNFNLRLKLEMYIVSDRSQHHLDSIKEAIMKLPSPLPLSNNLQGLQNKAAGTYLMPASPGLIRQIYQLEDMQLTALFQKHFPVPPSRLFEKDHVPNSIQKRETAVLETMKKINPQALEPVIIKAQRRQRVKKRDQEEINRIAQRDASYLKYHNLSPEEFHASEESKQLPPQINQWAKELMQDANTPYRPKCSSELSDRIMAAARKICAFSTVKHITSETALKSIFDDALYGRRTLMDFYIHFNPASLYPSDVLNGDANVVCMGPQDIDPKANGGIIIEFDLSKLIQKKNLPAFYKQRDLEYQVDKIRQVRLGSKTILFDHTGTKYPVIDNSDPSMTYLFMFNPKSGALEKIARAQKSSLISTNVGQMHEILTLNFFRFMDQMTSLNGEHDKTYINDFYQKVSQLTENELFEFLTDLEKNMTDTAEFNLYGAHQIDFSTIQNINARFKGYNLNVSQFINDLNQGSIDALTQAQKNIPELFQSRRFLDYLLLEIQNADVRHYLNNLRKQCNTSNGVHSALVTSQSDSASVKETKDGVEEQKSTSCDNKLSSNQGTGIKNKTVKEIKNYADEQKFFGNTTLNKEEPSPNQDPKMNK